MERGRPSPMVLRQVVTFQNEWWPSSRISRFFEEYSPLEVYERYDERNSTKSTRSKRIKRKRVVDVEMSKWTVFFLPLPLEWQSTLIVIFTIKKSELKTPMDNPIYAKHEFEDTISRNMPSRTWKIFIDDYFVCIYETEMWCAVVHLRRRSRCVWKRKNKIEKYRMK